MIYVSPLAIDEDAKEDDPKIEMKFIGIDDYVFISMKQRKDNDTFILTV